MEVNTGIAAKGKEMPGSSGSETMIDHDVGVSVASIYEIKKVDSDFFEEEIV